MTVYGIQHPAGLRDLCPLLSGTGGPVLPAVLCHAHEHRSSSSERLFHLQAVVSRLHGPLKSNMKVGLIILFYDQFYSVLL